MKSKEAQCRSRPSQPQSTIFCSDCHKRFTKKTRSPLPELPRQAQREAEKYADFVAGVLSRLNEIANQLTKSLVEDLSRSPQLHSHFSVYYADLLTQALGKELDALCQCVLINTIDIIGSSYEKWIRESSLEDEWKQTDTVY